MKRGQTVDESHNGLDEKHHLLAQLSGKRSTLREKHAHLCGEVPWASRSPAFGIDMERSKYIADSFACGGKACWIGPVSGLQIRRSRLLCKELEQTILALWSLQKGFQESPPVEVGKNVGFIKWPL